MSEPEDLTIAFSDDGVEVTKELDKIILSKGSWTTIVFRYQEWDKSKEDYGPVKYSIRRYQKRHDQYWQKSKFTLSSAKQARQLIDVLSQWLDIDLPDTPPHQI